MPTKKTANKLSSRDRQRPSDGSGFNQFDMRANKTARKPVLGMAQQHGSRRNMSESKSYAKTSRKDSLLKEFRALGKTGSFKDRRLDAKAQGMSADELASARFRKERIRQQEKSKKKRNAAFGLEDEEEGEGSAEGVEHNLLTHGGKPVKTMTADELRGDPLSDSDDDEELKKEIEAELMKTTEHGKHANKQDLYQEIMAKAKAYKADRQREKMKHEEELNALDAHYKGILPSLKFRPNKYSIEGIKAANALSSEGPDEFDMISKQLMMEGGHSAKAADRLMSSEEVALENAKRLEKLEEQRKNRMLNDEPSVEESLEEEEDVGEGEEEEGEEEEEDEDAAFDEEGGERDEVPEEAVEEAAGVESEDDEEEEEDIEDTGKKDGGAVAADDNERLAMLAVDESDSDIDDEDAQAVDEYTTAEERVAEEGTSVQYPTELPVGFDAFTNTASEDKAGLPFSVSCPQDGDAMEKLLTTFDPLSRAKLVFSLIACHNTPDERFEPRQLRVLLSSLFSYLADHEIRMLPLIRAPLIDLARLMPDCATDYFTMNLIGAYANSRRPDARAINMLHIVATVFQTTDIRHRVVQPALMLLEQWACCTQDMRLLALLYEFLQPAKRYSPAFFQLAGRLMRCGTETEQETAKLLTRRVCMQAGPEEKAGLQIVIQKYCPSLSRLVLGPHARLRLHAFRPIAVPSLEPVFYDPDSAQSHIKGKDPILYETQKMKRQYKQERRGAKRQLTKDASFLRHVRANDMQAKETAIQHDKKRIRAALDESTNNYKVMRTENARMDTKLHGSYRKNKAKKKANPRMAGNQMAQKSTD
ncbi:nop14, putative [Perkinsus marinus ATCC 50983]|uniref:Nop14, putative n=1 Tax=Perkinsus marinus (strain ATCC 50983 / TXsc) TaxID=423536 RepID=C5KWM8_PERM5|nr:nop14, putative [Perkinsus marinus ATCC 50983]EER11103.1 nop14, putative [Perkinsus marinus ATCC 50983]|eukprot:XP_002779308.1 nop14, putative [Perkinsus marinus ATCC 50983]